MSAHSSEELKSLQVRISKANALAESLSAEVKASQKKLSVAMADLSLLNLRMKELTEKAKDPIVSEHALLRYLERVRGINLQAVIQEILTERNKATINFVRTGKVPGGDGITLVVKDRVVVSVLTPELEGA